MEFDDMEFIAHRWPSGPVGLRCSVCQQPYESLRSQTPGISIDTDEGVDWLLRMRAEPCGHMTDVPVLVRHMHGQGDGEGWVT
jgi:hypothetical protein